MPNGSQYQTVQTGYAGPWVDQVLQALGAPTTDSNRAALRAWAASEGTVSSNNPLAFSGSYPGATSCIAQCGSSSPIMAYNSASQGAQNTAAFILGNSSYQTIVSAFRSDAGLGNIWQAINSSPWCSGCQSGAYPTALHAAAGGFFGGSSVAGGGGGGGGQSSGAYNPTAPVLSFPLLGTVINQGQEVKIKGWALMITGGFVMVVGLGVVLATLGLAKRGNAIVNAVPGARAVQSRASSNASQPQEAGRRESRQIEQRYQETERQQGPIGPRGGNQTSTRIATTQRRGRSVPGARPRPRPGSRESRERAKQPF